MKKSKIGLRFDIVTAKKMACPAFLGHGVVSEVIAFKFDFDTFAVVLWNIRFDSNKVR